MEMWPFSVLKRKRYERRYRAAWTLLLARYTYLRLTTAQQGAVRARDMQYLLACGDVYALVRAKRPQRYYSDYVIAMKSLGIPPALQNEHWSVPEDVDMPVITSKGWGFIPRGEAKLMRYWWRLNRDFRTFDPATEAAHRDLASRGVDVPIIDPSTLDDTHHMGLDGKRVTWRQWWRSHA